MKKPPKLTRAAQIATVERVVGRTLSAKPPSTVEDIVADTFEASLKYLRDQITLVIDGKGGKSRHDPAYRVATLTRMVSQIGAEQRKATAAARKQFDAYSHAGVIAWARTISATERRALVAALEALDQKGSILQ